MTFQLKCCHQNDQVMIVFTKPNIQLTKDFSGGGGGAGIDKTMLTKSSLNIPLEDLNLSLNLMLKKSVKTFLKYK